RADRGEALSCRLAGHATPRAPSADPDLVAARLDLATAWRRLPAVHQEALALTAWEGLSSPQAAVVLGISPTAYRLRLSRARRALRIHLQHPQVAPLRPVTEVSRP